MEIPDKKLEELYNGAAGKCSHFLFLRDEPKEFIEELLKENWIEKLSFDNNLAADKKMYRISLKLVTKFRELSKDEKAQINYIKLSQEERDAIDTAERLEREAKEAKKL